MESVIQKEKRCYVCGTTQGLHEHHIIYGTANRKKSEEYGFKVWLCGRHHNLSNDGVHFNRALDLHLKCLCETWWLENGHTEDEWRRVFGKWWIEEPEIEVPKIF